MSPRPDRIEALAKYLARALGATSADQNAIERATIYWLECRDVLRAKIDDVDRWLFAAGLPLRAVPSHLRSALGTAIGAGLVPRHGPHPQHHHRGG